MVGYWADYARPIIHETILEVTGKRRPPFTEEEIKAVKAALKDKYPFGERRYWPYKVWLKEISRALKGARPRDHAELEAAGQQKLFDR